jgi:hypothetical protein
MRIHLATLVLVSIFTVSILGFIGLNFIHNDSVAKGHCSASASAGVTCPIEDGIFAFANFHIKAFGGLVQSAFFSVSPIFLLTILVLAIALLFFVPDFLFSVSNRKYFRKNYEYKICDPGPKVISWLSHLENSPSFVRGA